MGPKPSLRLLLAPVALALVLSPACANPTVEACTRYQESLLALECVPDDFDPGVDCEEYSDYPCDASAYFECLEESYSCDAQGNLEHDPNACADAPAC